MQKNFANGLAVAAVLVALMLSASATAQVVGLYYQEVTRDGRIYVFNTFERYQAFQKTGEMGTSITLIGRGPNGETVVAENDTAVDLFLFKHNLPAYDRPTPKPQAPPPPAPPTTLKVGDGELKFGLLLQPWYVYDTSPTGTSTSYLRNVTGYSTFLLRRAEIKLSGKITPSWGFEVMVDPAKSQLLTAAGVPVTDDKILQDLAVTFLGVKGQEFSLGQKKIPITEEGYRGSSQLDFVERARITRAFSDRRETGFFYKGEFGKHVGAYASLTNGTPSNVVNYDKALFGAARVDIKPMTGLLVGASGGATVGGSVNKIQRDILNGFVKYGNIAGLPLGFEAEYLSATTGQTGKPTVKADGYYATVNYTIATKYQVAVRYDFVDRNKDVAGNQVKTWTGGFNYLIKGNNVKLSLDYYDVDEQGRKANNVLTEKYHQVVFQAQLGF
jgi:phosphate-selective porin OprO/OprP